MLNQIKEVIYTMPGPVEELFSKIFIRNKKPFQNKVKAVLLYFSGLSYRKTGKETYMSRENVRKLFRKARKFLGEIKPVKRKTIAMDETKLDGFYIWVARDMRERKKLFFMHGFSALSIPKPFNSTV